MNKIPAKAVVQFPQFSSNQKVPESLVRGDIGERDRENIFNVQEQKKK